MDHRKKETRWLSVATGARDSGEEGITGRQRKSVLLFSRRRGARPTCASGLRYEKNERESRVEGRREARSTMDLVQGNRAVLFVGRSRDICLRVS